MTLKVISAEKTLFEGEVSSVTLPGAKGSFTVLHNHASLISTLTAGTIKYTDSDTNSQTIQIQRGGLADIDHNTISVCLFG